MLYHVAILHTQTTQTRAAALCNSRTQLALSSALCFRKAALLDLFGDVWSEPDTTAVAVHMALTRQTCCMSYTDAGSSRTSVKWATDAICRGNRGQTLELNGVIVRSNMVPTCFKVHPCTYDNVVMLLADAGRDPHHGHWRWQSPVQSTMPDYRCPCNTWVMHQLLSKRQLPASIAAVIRTRVQRAAGPRLPHRPPAWQRWAQAQWCCP